MGTFVGAKCTGLNFVNRKMCVRIFSWGYLCLCLLDHLCANDGESDRLVAYFVKDFSRSFCRSLCADHLHTHFFHWATFFCPYFVCLSSPLFVLILLLFCLFGICCCSVIDSRSELSPRFPRIVFSILSSFLNHSTSFFRPANCVCSQLTLMCGFCWMCISPREHRKGLVWGRQTWTHHTDFRVALIC